MSIQQFLLSGNELKLEQFDVQTMFLEFLVKRHIIHDFPY